MLGIYDGYRMWDDEVHAWALRWIPNGLARHGVCWHSFGLFLCFLDRVLLLIYPFTQRIFAQQR